MAKHWVDPGRFFTYDWCRFRRDAHCYFTGILDESASQEAGHAVWVPMDRGVCFKSKWADQELCGPSQPGPNVTGGFLDSTVPWEAMGQRPYASPAAQSYAAPAAVVPAQVTREPSPLDIETRPVGAAPRAEWPDSDSSLSELDLNPKDLSRAAADLVQLRTAGLISFAECWWLMRRLGPSPPKLRIDAADKLTPLGTRLAWLCDHNVLSVEEMTHLAGRLPSYAGG